MSENTAPSPSKKFNPWLFLPLVLFGAMAALFYFQLTSGKNIQEVPSALINKPAAEFDLPELAGSGSVPLSLEYIKGTGKPVLMNVWASWCPPCRAEHPLLMEIAKDDRLVMTGLNIKDSDEKAVEFLEELGNPFAAIGVDARGRTGIDFGVYGQPETFLISADGVILYKHIGPLTPSNFRSGLGPAIEQAVAAAS